MSLLQDIYNGFINGRYIRRYTIELDALSIDLQNKINNIGIGNSVASGSTKNVSISNKTNNDNITHNFDTMNFISQAFDSNGYPIQGYKLTPVDNNTAKLVTPFNSDNNAYEIMNGSFVLFK